MKNLLGMAVIVGLFFVLPAYAANDDGNAAPAVSAGQQGDAQPGGDASSALFPKVSKVGNPSDSDHNPQEEHVGRDRDSGNQNRPMLP